MGIKGYVTNIPEKELSSSAVIDYYHDLWNVEQAFRMSKSDLQARPIFHRTEDAIRAHMLVCFMALMMGKYLEIKMHRSVRKIQEEIWRVHEIHLCYERTGEVYVKQMGTSEFTKRGSATS